MGCVTHEELSTDPVNEKVKTLIETRSKRWIAT